MSKILTEILNPLDETADSFIKSTVHLKEHLKILSIDPDCFLSTCDATNLFPSTPVKQTLGITFNLLKKDKTLNEQSYTQKEADQISKGDYKKERKAEKTILDNIRKKLKAELVKMGHKSLKAQKRFLV